MSVANVSGASTSLAQFFQRLSSSGSQQTSGAQDSSTAASSDSTTAATSGTTTASGQPAQQVHAHRHHHGGGGGGGAGGALRGKIESAVTGALQSYTGNGDVNEVIQNAIATAVKSGGDGTGAAAATQSPASPDSTNSAQSSDAFQQLLQSNGIDASQFRDDVAAGFKSASGSETASSGALTALPVGSYVDEQG